MSDPTSQERSDEWTADLRVRLDEVIDGYRASLHDSLDDVSEQEARFRLVPSKTTLLGLLKHVTYVEGVWFDQAVTGRSYAEIGIPTTLDRSFSLTRSDTIASVQAAHRQRCELSRQTMAALSLDDVVDGRGRRLVWAIAAACTPRARTARRARRHPPGADPRPTRPLTRAQAELKQDRPPSAGVG